MFSTDTIVLNILDERLVSSVDVEATGMEGNYIS
jgi:hypothetical protein